MFPLPALLMIGIPLPLAVISKWEFVTGCWYFASSLYHPRMLWYPRSPMTLVCWKLSHINPLREREPERPSMRLFAEMQSVSVMSELALQIFHP